MDPRLLSSRQRTRGKRRQYSGATRMWRESTWPHRRCFFDHVRYYVSSPVLGSDGLFHSLSQLYAQKSARTTTAPPSDSQPLRGLLPRPVLIPRASILPAPSYTVNLKSEEIGVKSTVECSTNRLSRQNLSFLGSCHEHHINARWTLVFVFRYSILSHFTTLVVFVSRSGWGTGLIEFGTGVA